MGRKRKQPLWMRDMSLEEREKMTNDFLEKILRSNEPKICKDFRRDFIKRFGVLKYKYWLSDEFLKFDHGRIIYVTDSEFKRDFVKNNCDVFDEYIVLY